MKKITSFVLILSLQNCFGAATLLHTLRNTTKSTSRRAALSAKRELHSEKHPLEQLVAEGNVEKLEVILEQEPGLVHQHVYRSAEGYEPHNHMGGTIVHSAAQHSEIPILELALKHGAQAKDANAYGWTPLMVASRFQNPSMVQRLLQIDGVPSSIDSTTTAGLTAFTLALDRFGSISMDIISELRLWGADPTIAGKGIGAHYLGRKTSALDLAVLKQHSEAIELILFSEMMDYETAQRALDVYAALQTILT